MFRTDPVRRGCICSWTPQASSFWAKANGNAKTHGPARRRQWRNLHIGIDAQTLQMRAICVTSNEVVDATVVADLLV